MTPAPEETIHTLSFDDLSLTDEVRRAIKDMGFEEPTPIQALAIPPLMEGKDVIGQAYTGTGKTAAFGIPILQQVDTRKSEIQALVLCPTRELAIQIAEELGRLAKFLPDVRVLPIYGGQPIERQTAALRKGVHVVIGTPGRIMDHMRRRTLTLSTVSVVVLDEADEMLDMGFRDDIETIVRDVPKSRQMVLFSATIPREILELAGKYLHRPVTVKVVHRQLTVPGVEQVSYEVREGSKLDLLSRLIDMYNLRLSLVFCNTKRKVDELTLQLQRRGYGAEALHGDLTQGQRDRVMAKFRSGAIEILVATDVAARGIDVEDIEAVFNYDVPQDEEYYVHRIGRTGRAGKGGRAFTFVSGSEMYKLREIQRYANISIAPRPLPSATDAEEMRITLLLNNVKEAADAGGLETYSHLVERILRQDYTSLDVAAALLKMLLEKECGSMDLNEIAPATPGIVRLRIDGGRIHGIRAKDILGAITGETNVPGGAIGNIDVRDSESYIDVRGDVAVAILAMNDKMTIRRRPFRVSRVL